jgi:hypothetical protein
MADDSADWQVACERAALVADDIDFAREVDRHTIPHWSHAWPRINALSRRGLVRVRPLNRWMAEVEATEAARGA